MTIYEKISLVISVVAILIPFFQIIWKKVFQKTTIKYYTDEKSTIFFIFPLDKMYSVHYKGGNQND